MAIPTWAQFKEQQYELVKNLTVEIQDAEVQEFIAMQHKNNRSLIFKGYANNIAYYYAELDAGNEEASPIGVFPPEWDLTALPGDIKAAIAMLSKYVAKIYLSDEIIEARVAEWKKRTERQKAEEQQHYLTTLAYGYYCSKSSSVLPKPKDTDEWKAVMLERINAAMPGFKIHIGMERGSKNNAELLRALKYYFMQDERFQEPAEFPRHTERGYTKGWSLQKGLWIIGDLGTGKTTIMRALCLNPLQQYRLVTSSAITEAYQLEGAKGIHQYYRMFPNQSARHYGHEQVGLCIDDAGWEKEGNSFGRKTEVISDIIYRRYDNKLKFNATHILSNMPPTSDDIKDRYADTVISRLGEMFNIIVIFGEGNRDKF